MSHVSDIKLRIADLDALAEAAPNCGFVFMRDQRTYATWNGAKNPCLHALRLQDHVQGRDFEIGLVLASADGQGGFDMRTDTYNQGRMLAAAGGPEFGRLRQEYAVAVASKASRESLARKGFTMVGRETLPSGVVRLRLRKR
jgi:hypothetical protein